MVKQLNEAGGILYNLQGFTPEIINQKYLDELKLEKKVSNETLLELQRGSLLFAKKFKNKSLIPKISWIEKDINFNEPLKVHRYTNKCPTDVLEIDPMVGCNVNCLYCLVSNGDHSSQKILYKNYGDYLRHKLEEEAGEDHYYYFAPKSEPFQEASLRTGIAHDILREFITFFKKNQTTKSKVFIISKSGKKELQVKHKGDTILDLMKKLSNNLVYDVSITVLPPELYPILEPRSASNDDRLEAAMICQNNNVPAYWALVQPILPTHFTDENIDNLLKKLKEANIERFKPEFLTLSIENLAWLGQIIGYFDKKKEKELYELYISPENMNNIKHNSRIAPDREFSNKTIMKLKKKADKYGLKITLCHWVRSDLNITPNMVPLIARTNWPDKKVPVCKPV
jgi:DNA repair photolyase